MKHIIVDCDGTIADLRHRLHYIQNQPKNYDKFYDECVNDTPIKDVIEVVQQLEKDYRIVYMSGRPDSHRYETANWILNHVGIFGSSTPSLYMRKAGDHRADHIVKEELLNNLLVDHSITKDDILCAIDDRPRIVALWKRLGITVMKVGDWDVEKDGRFKRLRVPTLTVMVGPSGAGKSSWIANEIDYNNIYRDQVFSSDNLRQELLGDWKRQDENNAIFQALHKLVKCRLECGLDTVVDSTNIRDADRKALLALAPSDAKIVYVVINRPMKEKIETKGWRGDWMYEHEQTFQSNLRNILDGDGDPRVTVVNLIKE